MSNLTMIWNHPQKEKASWMSQEVGKWLGSAGYKPNIPHLYMDQWKTTPNERKRSFSKKQPFVPLNHGAMGRKGRWPSR